jgi:hypothetical protein
VVPVFLFLHRLIGASRNPTRGASARSFRVTPDRDGLFWSRSRRCGVLVGALLGASGCSTSSGAGTADAASAPAGDAGGPDASSGPDGACTGDIVCDDFESYPPDAPPPYPWTVVAPNGSATIDTSKSHSGAQSVKITAPASSGSTSTMIRLTGSSRFPVAGNVVFGRMMFWLESAPTDSVHWTFIDGQGAVTDGGYPAIYRYGGQMPLTDSNGNFVGSQFIANYETPSSYNGVGPGSDCYRNAAEVVPLGAWACAEWEFDGPNDTMRFWLNGAPIDDLTVVGTGDGCVRNDASFPWTAPLFRQIDLGWESYQPDDARTLWIDDVAVATTRIGCPLP